MTSIDDERRMPAQMRQRGASFVLPFNVKGQLIIIARADFARLKLHTDMVIDFVQKKIARVPRDEAKLRLWNDEVLLKFARSYQKTEWRVLIARWASNFEQPITFVRPGDDLAKAFFRSALGIENETIAAPAASALEAKCDPEYSAGPIMNTAFNLPDKHLADAIANFPALDTFLTEPLPRKCCALFPGGADLVPGVQTVARLPGVTRVVPLLAGALPTKYLGLEDVPGHKFGESGFSPDDTVGHVYTARGGFVDLGHVRDLADTTRFLASKAIYFQRGGGPVVLSPEGGARRVRFKAADRHFPDVELAAMVAVRAAYDLAIWHEIVTWFNSVRHSSFSPEDNFSNLLGCLIGGRACVIKGQEYNRSIDKTLIEFLKTLDARPQSIAEKAIAEITGLWFEVFNDLTFMPLEQAQDNRRLLRRHVVPLPSVTPWLVTDLHGKSFHIPLSAQGISTDHTIDFDLGSRPQPYALPVPETTAKGIKLTDYYEVDIQVDTDKVPNRVLSGLRRRTRINSTEELQSIVDLVRADILAEYPDGDQPIAIN
jgi:hypothetical protein